jgi:hypothetical protein
MKTTVCMTVSAVIAFGAFIALLPYADSNWAVDRLIVGAMGTFAVLWLAAEAVADNFWE